MPVGDVKSDLQVVASGGLLSIMPPVGEEWVIHNIYYNNAVIIRLQKGGTVLNFDSDTAQGARMDLSIHVTNTQYLQILNNAGASMNIGYDGVQTK